MSEAIVGTAAGRLAIASYGHNMTSYGRVRVRLVATRRRKAWKIYRECLHEHRVPLWTYYSRLHLTIVPPVPRGLKAGPLVRGNFAEPPITQC